MGIIKIEWDFGKSKADKIIIWILSSILYYAFRYVQILFATYSKYKSKSEIPGFTQIDFKKTVYPFTFYGILLPTTLGYVVKIFVPEDAFVGLVVTYFGLLALIFILALLYFLYRFFIDYSVSAYYFFKSFVSTTIYSIKYLGKIFKKR